MNRHRAVLSGLLVLGTIYAVPTLCQPSRNRQDYLNLEASVVPEGIGLSVEEVLRLVVPKYDAKVKRILDIRSRERRPDMGGESYEAAIEQSRRVHVGSPPRDVLIVLVHELDNPCNLCHYTILGLVDLASKQPASFYAEGKPGDLSILGSGDPTQIRIVFSVGYGNTSGGYSTEWTINPILGANGSWRLRREHWRTLQRWGWKD